MIIQRCPNQQSNLIRSIYHRKVINIISYIKNIQENMEECSQLLLLFYRKVSTQHSRKGILMRKLHSLLKKCEMVEQDIQDPSHALKSKREPQHLSPGKLTELQRSVLRRGGQDWGLQCIFVSHSFEQNMLFAVLNRLIQVEDFLAFKCLEQKLNLELQESGFAENTLRIISYEWFRIGQILLNKKRLRWEKLLCESVHNLPVEVDVLFTKIFEGNGQYPTINQQILASISGMIKSKIVYFELESRRMLKNETYGLGQAEIYVCFLHDLNKYIVCSKPPRQSQVIKFKQQAISQLRLGFDSLLYQYEQGTASMSQLSNLSGLKLNEWKVMAYLDKK